MTDTLLLKEYINKSGFKVSFVASKCGLTYQGFKNKLENKSDFTTKEIMALRILLGIPMEESERIFFAGWVDNKST